MSNRTPNDSLSIDIREVGKSQKGLGWLSLNRYNAVCLNSTKIFFADIDCVPTEKNPIKLVYNWDKSFKNIEKIALDNNLTFRVYRTHSGIRLLETSKTWEGKNKKTLNILYSLFCDTAYIALTKKLNNFRVRLTPKPWRVQTEDKEIDFTIQSVFENYTPKYRIAAYLGTVGPKQEIIKEAAQIIALHDSICASYSDLALA